MTFGDYLRSAREGRRLTLDELAVRTKIKRHLLADLEADDLTRWPKYLVYRYGFLRAIADALALDRDQVLDRYDEAFPEYFPVAFDGGRRSRKPSSRGPVTFLRPAALAISLGLIAGLALTLLGSRPPVSVSPVADADAAVVHSGQDIELESGQPVESAAPDDVDVDVDVAQASGPAVVEGEVRVVSSPPGAFVTVNGIGRGRTPARVRYLPLGSYAIRVIQFGYRARESRVTLTPEAPVRRVRLALRARDARQASN